MGKVTELIAKLELLKKQNKITTSEVNKIRREAMEILNQSSALCREKLLHIENHVVYFTRGWSNGLARDDPKHVGKTVGKSLTVFKKQLEDFISKLEALK